MLAKSPLEDKILIRTNRSVFYKNNNKLTISYFPDAKSHSRILTLKDPFEIKLFLSINGNRKIKDILKELSSNFSDTPKRVLVKLKKVLKKHRRINPGFLKTEAKQIAVDKIDRKNLYYFSIANSINREYSSAKDIKKDHVDLSDYHLYGIKDANRQFDRNEMTLSHIFRNPHPALRGSTYGARLKQELFKRKPLNKKARILEIGAGTGWLARRFLDNLKKEDVSAYKKIRYFFLDLSPTLLKSQRKINSFHSRCTGFLIGNGQVLPFKNNSLDHVIINEVIADFDVVKLDKNNLFKSFSGFKPSKAKDAILSYGISIDDAPKKFLFGLGIVKLLKELKRVLKPEGAALIIEYGSMWSYPKVVKLKGHKEYSVHFGHLKQVANALGFRCEMTNLLDFLKFQKDTKTLDKISSYLLDKILCKKHPKISSLVFTKEMLKNQLKADYRKFKNMRFMKLKDNIAGFHIKEFKVAVLKKPRIS